MTPDRQDGTVTAFLAVLAVALFAAAGLVVDGGRALAAREQAAAVAEQAARAGAEAVSVASLHRGTVVLDPGQAEASASGYLQQVGVRGAVAVVGDSVTVTVSEAVPTTMLDIVGIRSMTVHASATATDLAGVTRGAGG